MCPSLSMQICVRIHKCFQCVWTFSTDTVLQGHLSLSFCVCVVSGSRLLQPAHVCDILKALILVLSFSMTHYLDYSMMYHLIRGQSVIKLYIIYNMLEVTNMEFGCKVTACIACNCIQSLFGVSIFVYSSLDLNTHKISLTSGICHEAFIT